MFNVVVLEIIKDQLLGYATSGVLTHDCQKDDFVEMWCRGKNPSDLISKYSQPAPGPTSGLSYFFPHDYFSQLLFRLLAAGLGWGYQGAKWLGAGVKKDSETMWWFIYCLGGKVYF